VSWLIHYQPIDRNFDSIHGSANIKQKLIIRFFNAPHFQC
jgi:hypothetical protein